MGQAAGSGREVWAVRGESRKMESQFPVTSFKELANEWRFEQPRSRGDKRRFTRKERVLRAARS